MAHEETAPTIYGLMAEFETPDALVSAAEKARLAGYRKMDAYTPIPIEELSEALGLARTRLPKLVFLGGGLGGLGGGGPPGLFWGGRLSPQRRGPALLPPPPLSSLTL